MFLSELFPRLIYNYSLHLSKDVQAPPPPQKKTTYKWQCSTCLSLNIQSAAAQYDCCSHNSVTMHKLRLSVRTVQFLSAHYRLKPQTERVYVLSARPNATHLSLQPCCAGCWFTANWTLHRVVSDRSTHMAGWRLNRKDAIMDDGWICAYRKKMYCDVIKAGVICYRTFPRVRFSFRSAGF
jgi:hypothetical protein